MGLIRKSVSPSAAPAPARIDSADSGLRRIAARRMGETKGQEADLLAALRHEGDPTVREALLLSLVLQDTPEAAEGLASCLTSDAPALRNGALESLAGMPDHAGRLLDHMAEFSDPDARIFALLLAGELPQDWIEDWLANLLEDDPEANARAAIAEVLAESGTAKSIPALSALALRFPEEPFVATAALARLGKVR